ncbi:hypothetical protein H0H93_006847 [Arthromyces matolae]|nr:hypothetical protein H0H93_006847 [Arthromyces matolae]
MPSDSQPSSDQASHVEASLEETTMALEKSNLKTNLMHPASLPDEIIKEILSPVLTIPDDAFRSCFPFSTFSNDIRAKSNCNLLVVCKSWLRVATPLLYHVVTVRSQRQAEALARTLKGNELLATFIKKLRLESGYGPPMQHVLRLGKNIEELYLMLSTWSSDNVTGLCEGLPLVNPRCLILDTTGSLDSNPNATTQTLIEALCQCIKKWDKLDEVELPFRVLPTPARNIIADICDALTESQSLKVITLKEPQYNQNFIRRLADSPSLEAIHVKPPPGVPLKGPFVAQRCARAEMQADPILGKLLRFDFSFDQDDV